MPELGRVTGQRLALEQLHRVPRNARIDALIEDPHDAWMLQPAQRSDLAAHAAHVPDVLGEQTLERDDLTALRVAGAEHDAGSATADHMQDPIRTDPLARGVLRGRCSSMGVGNSGIAIRRVRPSSWDYPAGRHVQTTPARPSAYRSGRPKT